MRSQFQLTLLGQFQLTFEGKPVAGLTSEKIQALLAYLAAEQERVHRREFLAELLWPDRPDGVARQNLRQALSRLQRVLPTTAEPLLQISRQAIRINATAHVQVDLVTLTDALAQVQQHQHDAVITCAHCCQLLAAAIASYQGDFLAGLFCDSPAFDEWAMLKREWLRREALRVLDLLVQHQEALGQWQPAYRCAWRRVEIDPLLEEAHQQVMRALAYSGRRTEALAQYDTFVQLLREELGVAPAMASTALYEAIRANQLVPTALQSPATTVQTAPQTSIQHNLPTQQSPFVGRRRVLHQIEQRLAQPECHLLTLVGPGGAGKTRLALEAANRRREQAAQQDIDGIYFVALATVEDDDQFLTAVAAALDFQFADDAQGRSARLAALCTTLQHKHLLLVLDNLEQIADHTEIPSVLLEAAPHVQLLVTSRVPLHLRAEWLLDIGGLEYPSATEARSAVTFEAVQFFTAAAARVLADFTLSNQTLPAVSELCTLTQGMPLALELAAAQIRTVPLPVLVNAVQQNLDTLATTMRDVPERHRSLRAVFNHSWQLLTPALQQLFRQLAVFRGPFDAAAAITITSCSTPALKQLCACSLLRAEETGGTTSYAMHEVLRQYALEQLQLDPGDAAATYRQHSHYYLTLVAEAEERLGSSQAATSAAEVRAAFEQIRGGWQWAVAHSELPAMQQSIHGLLRYFVLTSQAEEGGRMFDGALRAVSAWLEEQANLDHETEQSAKQLLAELHALRARLFFKQARYTEGVDHAQQALTLADSVADTVGAYRAATLANLYWGICLLSQGEYEAAEVKLKATLVWARAHPWPKLESDALRALGILADQQNELAKARHFYEASLAISQELDDPRGTSAALGNVGSICRQQGDFVAARAFLEQSLAIHRTIGDRSSEGRTLTHLGELCSDLEEYADAERYLGESVHILQGLGEEHYAADALVVLGQLYHRQGQLYHRQGQVAPAIACWEEALPIYEAANEAPGLAEVQRYLQLANGPDAPTT